MGSLTGANQHRLHNELQIFGATGQVSSFFASDQELETFEADEVALIVKEWVAATRRLYAAPYGNKETVACELLRKFEMFREDEGIEDWTHQNLKALRLYCAGKLPPSPKRRNMEIG
jgi:hypothetical protein